MAAATRQEHLWTWVRRSAMGTIALVSVLGAAHTPLLRPWLVAAASRAGGCPVGGEAMSAESRQVAQQAALALLRTEHAAEVRPAFGFHLGRTTLGQVEAWARSQDVGCDAVVDGLRCTDIPASATALQWALHDLRFGFDADGRLTSLDAALVTPNVDDALQALRSATTAVAQAGSATLRVGEPNATYLAAGPMRQTGSEYRFSNYRANVRATSLGGGRVTVRATVQAIDI